jgi:DNA-binding transcriptional LysR family regulator
MSGREGRLLDGRLKIRHLVLVQTLTQHPSIVAAANALHVTQTVLTRRLRELEQILTVRQLLLDGDFVAFLPALIVQQDDRLRVLDIDFAGSARPSG